MHIKICNVSQFARFSPNTRENTELNSRTISKIPNGNLCKFNALFYDFLLLFIFYFQFCFQHRWNKSRKIILMMPQLFGNSFCGFIYDAILVPGGYLIMVYIIIVGIELKKH